MGRCILWKEHVFSTITGGSVTLFYCIMITAILGFCAIVYDVGYIMLEKQTFQNAIDAAALTIKGNNVNVGMKVPNADYRGRMHINEKQYCV